MRGAALAVLSAPSLQCFIAGFLPAIRLITCAVVQMHRRRRDLRPRYRRPLANACPRLPPRMRIRSVSRRRPLRCTQHAADPNQCEYCKCRSCSMCKPCASSEAGDTTFESCEDWCSVREHCSHCKCRACSVCQACTPADLNDVDYVRRRHSNSRRPL